MNDKAYFFQGDALLLPQDFSDLQAGMVLSAELAKEFTEYEAFEIPAIDSLQPSVINAVSVPPGVELPTNWRSVPVRQVFSLLCGAGEDSAESAPRILRACHIAQWRRESRFCGSCGAKNEDVPNETQRRCPACGRSEFPRICPAIIVVITDSKNRILLAHNKRFKDKVYSHISGFNEAGETLEETVVREVREEVNIEVEGIEYLKSQPWPFPNSLMVGFKARYLSGTVKPDGIEIEDAKWFSADNLPQLPAQGSLSRFLIAQWLEGNL